MTDQPLLSPQQWARSPGRRFKDFDELSGAPAEELKQIMRPHSNYPLSMNAPSPLLSPSSVMISRSSPYTRHLLGGLQSPAISPPFSPQAPHIGFMSMERHRYGVLGDTSPFTQTMDPSPMAGFFGFPLSQNQPPCLSPVLAGSPTLGGKESPVLGYSYLGFDPNSGTGTHVNHHMSIQPRPPLLPYSHHSHPKISDESAETYEILQQLHQLHHLQQLQQMQQVAPIQTQQQFDYGTQGLVVSPHYIMNSLSTNKNHVVASTQFSSSACAACYRSKLSCDKGRPCKRCIKSGRACVNRPPVKLGRPRKMIPHEFAVAENSSAKVSQIQNNYRQHLDQINNSEVPPPMDSFNQTFQLGPSLEKRDMRVYSPKTLIKNQHMREWRTEFNAEFDAIMLRIQFLDFSSLVISSQLDCRLTQSFSQISRDRCHRYV